MHGNVSGTVVQADTGKAIAGATVVCERNGTAGRFADGGAAAPLAVSTDGAGSFRFDALPRGDWTLRVDGAGRRRPAQATVRVFDNASSEVTIEVVGAAPARPDPWTRYPAPDLDRYPDASPPARFGSVRGRVIDAASGAPVAYATIIVVRGACPVPEHVFTTSSDGWFELNEVPVGDWLLRAHREGGGTGTGLVCVFASALSEMTIEVDGYDRLPGVTPPARPSEPFYDDDSAEEPPSRSGRVVGQVSDAASGRPVADAAVTIVRGAGPMPDIASLTDRHGRFVLDDLAPGAWLLRAMGPDGRTAFAQVNMRAGAVTDASLRIGAGDAWSGDFGND